MTRPRGRSRTRSIAVVSGGFTAARGLARWLDKHLPAKVRGNITIKIVTDREMAKLNGAFRGKPKPTDVLSFPAETALNARGALLPLARAERRASVAALAVIGGRRTGRRRTALARTAPSRTPFGIKDLGDIAIAKGVAAKQARALGHPVSTELRVLALHGILHLLGYDHERDRGEMRVVEERWRKRAGLPVGLVTRTVRPSDSTTR